MVECLVNNLSNQEGTCLNDEINQRKIDKYIRFFNYDSNQNDQLSKQRWEGFKEPIFQYVLPGFQFVGGGAQIVGAGGM